MPKRFTDTGKWSHPWFQELPNEMKLAWLHILDECDSTGVWRANLPLLSFRLHQGITRDDLDRHLGRRIIWLDDEKVWIPSFLPFQFKHMNPDSPIHRTLVARILRLTERLPLEGEAKELVDSWSRVFQPSADPLPSLDEDSLEGLPTLQDKDKDKDKDKRQKKRNTLTLKFDLEALYRKYPLKKGKQKGLEKAKRDVQTQQDYDDLSRAIDKYAAHCRRDKTTAKYVKHFATFMTTWREVLDEDWGKSSLNGSGRLIVGPPPAIDPIQESIQRKLRELGDGPN